MLDVRRDDAEPVGNRGAKFERRRREWNVEGYRTAALTSIPLISMSLGLEEFLGVPAPFERNALRISCLLALIFGLFLTERRRELALASIDWLMLLTYAWVGVFCICLMLLHDGYESPFIFTVAFCVVGVPSVTLWPARLFFAYEGTLLALYLAPLALGMAPIRSVDVFLVHLYFLFGLMLIGAAAQWMHNRMVRNEVDAQYRLSAAVTRIASMKAERHAWLERLAQFLRHELKNQMVAVGTSLELMAESTPPSDRERYMGRARLGLERMSRLVSSATEATSLEAALTTEARTPVDLSALVEDRIDILRQVTDVHRLAVDVEPGVIVLGTEDRLAQMIDKLLSNAAEHAYDTGQIRVMLRRNGSEAVLTVENDGEPLPPNKQPLFDAFVSVGKGGPSSTNLGLGLFVTRTIAEFLDGRVIAEGLPDSAGARFVVRLPIRVIPG